MDLLSLIEADTRLKRVASTGGGEYAGPCPACGGRDRFHVWPAAGRYWCRGCDKKGDTIQYLRDFRSLSFQDACKVVGKKLEAPASQHQREHTILVQVGEEYAQWSRAMMIDRTDLFRDLMDELEIAEIAVRACARCPDLYSDEERDYWSLYLGDLYLMRDRLEDELDVLTYDRREAERVAWWDRDGHERQRV